MGKLFGNEMNAGLYPLGSVNTVQQHTAAIMYCIPAFFSTAHFLTVVHFTQPYQQFFLGRFYKQPTTAIVTALGASGTTR